MPVGFERPRDLGGGTKQFDPGHFIGRFLRGGKQLARGKESSLVRGGEVRGNVGDGLHGNVRGAV